MATGKLNCASLVIARTVGLLALAASQVIAGAEESYPSRPVHIISSHTSTSGGGIRTRQLADNLSLRLGQPFVIDNRPGAGSTIATKLALGTKPDGYVLLAISTPAYSIAPMLYTSAAYAPATSFSPIAVVSQGFPLLVVHPSSQVKSVQELAALAKTNPTTVSFAITGKGGGSHLPAELFRRSAGVELLYIPYKSEGDGIIDVIRGEVTAGFFYPSAVSAQIKAGKLRALAVARPERNPSLPEVPTMAEAGYAGCEFASTSYLMAPAGMPQRIASRLNDEVLAIMHQPATQASYAATGTELVSLTLDEVQSLLTRENELNVSLVKVLDLKPE